MLATNGDFPECLVTESMHDKKMRMIKNIRLCSIRINSLQDEFSTIYFGTSYKNQDLQALHKCKKFRASAGGAR